MPSIMSPRRLVTFGFAAAMLGSLPACGAFDEGGATVFVFSTHHATPEDGVFPDRGEDDKPRRFLNDLGWEVTLLESYVTISAVSLIGCDGVQHPLDMFWGPCPEDLRDEDLEVLTVAGRKVAPGSYCELWVQYGPYETPIIDEEEMTRHETPGASEVLGTSMYFDGGAQIDPEVDPIQFFLTASGEELVKLDLSTIADDGPLRVDQKEDFPLELTISKTYDRFFDGIDFDTYDPAALQGNLLPLLERDTKVNLGTRVNMDNFEDGGAPEADGGMMDEDG